MDVSATSALNLYSYQASLAAGGQSSAILGVLTQAYTNSSSALSGTDALASLAGYANLGPLVSAIYNQSGSQVASTAAGIQGLSSAQLFGGVDTTAASSLLSGLTSDAGSTDFLSALTGPAALATAATLARQTYGTGNLTSDAQDQAAATTAAAAKAGDTTGTGNPTATYLAQATAAVQLASMNNTFSLLA